MQIQFLCLIFLMNIPSISVTLVGASNNIIPLFPLSIIIWLKKIIQCMVGTSDGLSQCFPINLIRCIKEITYHVWAIKYYIPVDVCSKRKTFVSSWEVHFDFSIIFLAIPSFTCIFVYTTWELTAIRPKKQTCDAYNLFVIKDDMFTSFFIWQK